MTCDEVTCSSDSRACSLQCRSCDENPSNLADVIASAVRPFPLTLSIVSPTDNSTSDCPTPVTATTLLLITDTNTSVNRPWGNADVPQNHSITAVPRQTLPARINKTCRSSENSVHFGQAPINVIIPTSEATIGNGTCRQQDFHHVRGFGNATSRSLYARRDPD